MQKGRDSNSDPNALLVELDGPGVSPSRVDAPVFLRLAAAFYRLVLANAAELHLTLSLTGVEIIDKCAAVRVLSDSSGVAQICSEHALKQIGGQAPPRGLAVLADEARAAVMALAPDQTARIIIGPWSRPVPIPPPEPDHRFDSIFVGRVVPMRVGGLKPAVSFASLFEDTFRLFVTEEQARELGGLLYQEIEIEARVSRDGYEKIDQGVLLDIVLVEETDPKAAWKEWFKSVGGSEWDQIDDLDAELRH